MLLFNIMLFLSNSELKTRPVSCQTNRIWKNIFIDNILTRIFSYSILKVNLCTSRRTQLQHKLEISVSLVFFELLLFVCIDVLRRCQHFCSHDATFPIRLG